MTECLPIDRPDSEALWAAPPQPLSRPGQSGVRYAPPRREDYSRNLVGLDDEPAATGGVLVCLTLYNEPAEKLRASLSGLVRNQAHLYRRFGESAPKIAIFILLDGRDRVSADAEALLLDLGFSLDAGPCEHDPAEGNRLVLQAQRRRISDVLQTLGEDASAGGETGAMEIFLGVKERNAGKLDTHAWVFWGLCERRAPEFMLQVDAGTIPADDCVANLLDHMAAEPRCAALATNTLLDAPALHKIGLTWQYGDFLWEKIADWPIGHLLGYIEVIPGQCSMVRWAALRANALRPQDSAEAAEPPVDRYLRGVESQKSLLERNLFLAEDRVIALEILKEKGAAATIRHASLAGSETDPCTSFAELLHQRRRWINSTTVARLSALCALPVILRDQRRSGLRRAEIGMAMLSIFLQLIGQTVLPSLVAVCFSIGARKLAVICGYDVAADFRTVAAMSFLLAWTLVVVLGRQLKPPTAMASWMHQSAAILLSAAVALIMLPFIGGPYLCSRLFS